MTEGGLGEQTSAGDLLDTLRDCKGEPDESAQVLAKEAVCLDKKKAKVKVMIHFRNPAERETAEVFSWASS